MKTNWNLRLLYTSPRDPRIEKDAVTFECTCERFEKTYRKATTYLRSETALLKALQSYERLLTATAPVKPLVYFHYTRELDGTNDAAAARIRQFQERFTKAENRITFFHLALGKIPKQKQRQFLTSAKLARYRRFLQHTFEVARFNLTEPEERILALKGGPAREMWVSGVDNTLNQLTVRYGKRNIPINEAIGLVSTIRDTKKRRALFRSVTDALQDVGAFAESEMNAVLTDKKINDELRGFHEPYEATVLAYENNPESVQALVDTVTKQFRISRKFYSLKRKLLSMPQLQYADRGVSIGRTTKRYTFTEAVEITARAFKKADTRYAAILERFLKNGQIDVLPQTGKAGGAYCSPVPKLPTFVLLNHVNDFCSVSTLAHEMGHAIHSEQSKQQPIMYESYSTAVAETASTFFEGIVFEDVFETLSKREQIVALHDKIQDEIATIFRQIAFFNFELQLHRRLRKEGWIPKKDIVRMLNTHMQSYLGPAVKMHEDDGYFFIAVSHFRRPFYVYSYAYGQLISKALLARYRSDPSYIKKIDQFLSAGSSKAPEQIFADIGIAVGPELFAEGLKEIERDIRTLECLMR